MPLLKLGRLRWLYTNTVHTFRKAKIQHSTPIISRVTARLMQGYSAAWGVAVRLALLAGMFYRRKVIILTRPRKGLLGGG
jgi:hypothetical protein